MKHRHHKVPKHAGGTDDKSNIEELTIQEHAEAHRLLFEAFGRQEDRIAWLGLSGQIKNEALIAELASLGGEIGKISLTKWHDRCRGATYDEIYGAEKAVNLRKLRRDRASGERNPMHGKHHTEKWCKEHSKRLSGENHFNYGKPAFNSGRIWMNDGVQTRMIPKADVGEALALGWKIGRRLLP